MPQLDLLTYSSQLFWLVICFTFLYLVLSKFALPKLVNISAERNKKIEEILILAEKNNAESHRLKAEYEKILTDAIIEKNLKIDAAVKEIQELIDKKTSKHNLEIQEIIKNSEKQLESFKNQSSDLIKKITEEATINIMAMIFDLKLSKQDIEKTIAKAEVQNYDA